MYKIRIFIQGQHGGKEFATTVFWLPYLPRIGECLCFLNEKNSVKEYYFKVTKVEHAAFYESEKLDDDGCILFEFEEPPLSENWVRIEAIHIDESEI